MAVGEPSLTLSMEMPLTIASQDFYLQDRDERRMARLLAILTAPNGPNTAGRMEQVLKHTRKWMLMNIIFKKISIRRGGSLSGPIGNRMIPNRDRRAWRVGMAYELGQTHGLDDESYDTPMSGDECDNEWSGSTNREPWQPSNMSTGSVQGDPVD